MIEKILIENFRGFSRLECSALAPITLVGGRNNSGKSSFLEAIAINSNVICFDLAIRLNEVRGIKLRKFQDVQSLYNEGDTTRPIRISTWLDGSERRSVEATCKEPDVITYQPPKDTIPGKEFMERLENLCHVEYHVAVVSDKDPGRNIDETLYFLQDGDNHFAFTRLTRSDVRELGQYVSPRSMANIAALMEPLFREKRKKEIDEALHSVDERIVGVEMFDGRVWVNDATSKNMLPIQVLGDGMMKIVTYLSIVLTSAKGAVVCLDEIENGLHYSAMLPMWRAVVRAAVARGVQLVVTSHNIEMMQQISRDEEVADVLAKQGVFAYKKLVRFDDGSLAVKNYDFDQFAYAVQNSLEVR